MSPTPSPTELRFDRSLRERWRRAPSEEGAGALFEAEVPAGWMQGRSAFGGLTAALAAGLARTQVDPARRLRTLSIQLLGPLVPGPVEGRYRLLREGKGVSFTELRLHQDGGERAVASAIFVRPREGSLEVPVAPAPARPDPETLADLPYLPGRIPEFTQHVAMRWARGAPPFSGGKEARFEGYCRFRVPAGDLEGLLGLLDVWPSPTLSMLSRPTPGATVSWTAHLLEIPERHAGWFFFEYEAIAGGEGFATIAGRLYHPEGRLIAWTEQLMAVFD